MREGSGRELHACGVCGFDTVAGWQVIDPISAALCDTLGRKVVMLVRGPTCALCRLLQLYGLANPSAFLVTELAANAIEGRSTPGGLTGNSFRVGWEAALADMYSGDAAQLGGAISWMNMMPSLSAMVTPIWSAALAAHHMRNPFIAGVVCAGVMTALLAGCFTETMEPAEARPLTAGSASPFAFSKLFNRTAHLRRLGLMEILNNFGSMRAIWSATDVLRMEQLGWGVAERSQMMSMTGMSSIPGGLAVRSAIGRLGAPPGPQIHRPLCILYELVR